MNPRRRWHFMMPKVFSTVTFIGFVFVVVLSGRPLRAQDAADLKARVAELKESSGKNKEALAQYTWKETVKIILKGEEKKTEHFQVHQGPDGKPVKTSLDPAAPAAQEASGGRGGRLKQHVVEKKKEEFKEYAEQMKELAQHYVPPDKEAIQEAFQRGGISLVPSGDNAGEIKLVIHNYYKNGDSVTLRLDKNQKQLQAIAIATYMNDPQDAMNLTVAFGRLPDGTNHVSTVTIEGVSKQLTVNTTNSDYRKL
jgi:hypothetical protein